MLLLALTLSALAVPCPGPPDPVLDRPLSQEIGFEYGKATLTADSLETVQLVACAFDLDTELTVQVEVHTDSRGSGTYNLRMSQERADAVRQALIQSGADPERVTAVGYGELYPVDTNATAEGREHNRRVELRTEPPSQRPPRPEVEAPPPEPAPQPAPEPVDVCDLAAQLRPGAVPSWPGARCQRHESAWTCVVPASLGQLQACLPEAVRDGSQLFLRRDGGTVVLTAQGSQTKIEGRPR